MNRNDSCEYGLHLEVQTSTKVTLETHVSSSSYSYHDAVLRAANSSHLPPLHFCAFDGLNVGIVLRHPRLCTEKLSNFWRLLILVFTFTVCKRTLFYLVDFYFLCINLVFVCYNREVAFQLEFPLLQDEKNLLILTLTYFSYYQTLLCTCYVLSPVPSSYPLFPFSYYALTLARCPNYLPFTLTV